MLKGYEMNHVKRAIVIVLLMQGLILVAAPVQARMTGCGGSRIEASGQAGPKPVADPRPKPSC